MMLAAGPAMPFIEEAMEAGWRGQPGPPAAVANAPLASTYFNLRKTTIYGGSNEVQRNIVLNGARLIPSSGRDKNMDFVFLTTRNNCATPYASGWTRATVRAPPRWRR